VTCLTNSLRRAATTSTASTQAVNRSSAPPSPKPRHRARLGRQGEASRRMATRGWASMAWRRGAVHGEVGLARLGEAWRGGAGRAWDCYRSAAEFWLLGTRGDIRPLNRSTRNLIVAPVRGHSGKPDEMRRDLEALWPGPARRIVRAVAFRRMGRVGQRYQRLSYRRSTSVITSYLGGFLMAATKNATGARKRDKGAKTSKAPRNASNLRRNTVAHPKKPAESHKPPHLPLLTGREAAALAGCSIVALTCARKNGDLRSYKLEGAIRFDRNVVLAWARRNGVGNPTGQTAKPGAHVDASLEAALALSAPRGSQVCRAIVGGVWHHYKGGL
jgi:Helix-turn-helix domain